MLQQTTGVNAMIVQKGKEQEREDKRKRADLDKRYGKIGISAVAGAVKHHRPSEKQKPAKKDRVILPQDSD
jgi:hypothetical protein